jgi:hypothetical protein
MEPNKMTKVMDMVVTKILLKKKCEKPLSIQTVLKFCRENVAGKEKGVVRIALFDLNEDVNMLKRG